MESMATTRPATGYKRALQACETCRRKKTRCPGEKPICSNCSRLRQNCRYPRPDPSLEPTTLGTDRHLEARLAQLEQKLDLILEKPSASPKQGETPRTSGSRNEAASTTSPTIERLTAGHSRLLPSAEVVDKAIDIYFRCCHRQPCWIFESRKDLTSNAAEELLLVVLGIGSQYEELDFGDGRLQSSSACTDAARTQILLKLANSTVDLSTLQALCLLAFANLVAGDIQLATLHVTLAGTLMQMSGLDSHNGPERTSTLEEQRRLFWSVRALNVLCGLQIKIPSLLDLKAPRNMLLDEVLSKSNGQAPLLPHEVYNNHGSTALGIWAHMVRSASLWGEVREYVARCHQGHAVSPWHPDSGYIAIKSHLYDMEAAFPIAYRFDSAKFSERTPEEIEQSRDFWLPWISKCTCHESELSVSTRALIYKLQPLAS